MSGTTYSTHIVSTPGVRGGKPSVLGHRVAVHDIAVRTQDGMTAQEVAKQYRLTLGDVHAALSYYYDHRDQIDREIVEEDEEIRRAGRADHSPAAERARRTRRPE